MTCPGDTRARLLAALIVLGDRWNDHSGVGVDILTIIAGNDRIEDLSDRTLGETANGLCQILGHSPIVRFGPRRQIRHIGPLHWPDPAAAPVAALPFLPSHSTEAVCGHPG